MATNIKFEVGSEGHTFFKNQNEDREALHEQAALWTALYAAQLLIYYSLWDEAIENRDAVIDDEKVVLDYLYEKDMGVDYPMMQKKQEILGLALPPVDMCSDAARYTSESMFDGEAVDDFAVHLSKADCCGAPWETTEGSLYAARAAAYNGGVLANAAKRRREDFQEKKTRLALQAQSTARMSIDPILSGFAQAASIYEGLASIYLKGFNSAGAGLGLNLQRLASSYSTNGAI